MTWKDPVGIILPLSSFLLGFLVHYLLKKLTIYKFQKLGHLEMAELLSNESKNKKQ